MIKPSDLAELPFLIFIYIADAEQQASVNEVEQFNTCVTQSDWCKSSFLKETLALIESKYDEFWKAYSNNGNYADLENRLKASILKLSELSDAEYQVMRRDLIELGKLIAKASNRLGVISGQKETALVTIENLLSKPTAVAANQAAPSIVPRSGPPINLEGVNAEEIWPLSKLGANQATFWKRGKVRLVCNKIIRETHDVKTFCFISADEPLFFMQKPGQFISLELPIDGKKVVRSYTISSSPSRPSYVSVTVKRVKGGLVSNWMHDNLKVGDEIGANGPHGKFNCFDIPAKKMLLISGGSGITPMMSITRWACDTGSDADIVFLHNAQSPRDLIFEDELKLLSAQNPNVRLALCVSKTQDMPWGGFIGRFCAKSLALIAPDFHERAIFVCGPEPYMEAVHHVVQSVGFDMKNYFSESFGGAPPAAAKAPQDAPTVAASAPVETAPVKAEAAPTPPPAPKPAAAKPAAGQNCIKFKQQNKEVTYGEDDTVLDVAENADIEIEYSCRAGNCGTCKVLKLEGDVEMDESGGISSDEISEGYILACIAKPKGRLVLDV